MKARAGGALTLIVILGIWLIILPLGMVYCVLDGYWELAILLILFWVIPIIYLWKTERKTRWIFIILKDGGLDRLQFRDGLFLIGKELDLKPFYKFESHAYGPFCMEVIDDLARWESMKLIAGTVVLDDKQQPQNFIYELTDKGRQMAEALYKKLPSAEQEKISEITELLKLSLKKRVAKLSKIYPEFYLSAQFLLEDLTIHLD